MMIHPLDGEPKPKTLVRQNQRNDMVRNRPGERSLAAFGIHSGVYSILCLGGDFPLPEKGLLMRTPGYSISQKIGTLGKRVFVGGHPDSWFTESEPAQNSDFGFDMSMWVENLGNIRGRFSVQIKAGASTSFAGPAGDEFIQVELTPETCNIFLQDGQPVLLVFVALQDETRTTGAEMYYLWIEEEMRKRLGDRQEFDESDPDNMTFRVPVTNQLTKQSDISAHLEVYWSHTRIANRLRSPEGTGALSTVSALSPRAQSALTAASHRNLDRWLTNETMTGDNLWPTAKSGTAIAKIKQLNEFLNHGNAAEADRLIDELTWERLDDSEVLAEFRYQEGRRAFLDGDPKQALDRFAEAGTLQPESDVPPLSVAERFRVRDYFNCFA